MSRFFDRQSLKIFFLIAFHYLKRNIYIVVFSIFAVITLFFLQLQYKIFFPENILTEGFIGTYQEHDLPLEVTRLISKGLVEVDSAGRMQPDIAKEWVDIKGDASEFKFTLKDNLFWSDGTKVKSSDLDFGIPETTTEFPDDNTIIFKLKEAYSPFPSLLTKPLMKKNTLIGIGPYAITKIEKSRIFITKITLKSKDKALPTIFIRFYPTEQIGITGFELGEISSIFGLSNKDVLQSNPLVKIKQKTDFTKIVTIAFNNKDVLLSNRSMRQSLSFSTPAVNNEEIANNSFPHFFWAYDSGSKKYLSNPEDAKAALERAKKNLPAEKLKEGITLTSAPNLESLAKKIVEEWKKIGLDVKLRIEPGIPQNFQALLITQSIFADPDQYLLWHSLAQNTNLSKYSSVRVDKDLEDGRKATKEADRKAAYFDFQKILLEDAPAVFLYFPKYNIVYLKKSEKLLEKVLDLQLAKF